MRHVHTDDLRGSLSLLTAALSRSRQAAQRAGARRGAAHRAAAAAVQRSRDPVPRCDDRCSTRRCPTASDIVVDAGTSARRRFTTCRCGATARFIVALGMGGMGYSFGAGVGVAFGDERSRQRRSAAANGRHRRRRLILMHGMEIHTALQYRLPVTVPAVRQPCARDVRDARAAVLRRPLQLQPVRAKSVRRRAGCDVPRPARRSTSTTSTSCPARCATALDTDGPSVVSVECSADEIPPFRKLSRHGTPRDNRSSQRRTTPNVAARA